MADGFAAHDRDQDESAGDPLQGSDLKVARAKHASMHSERVESGGHKRILFSAETRLLLGQRQERSEGDGPRNARSSGCTLWGIMGYDYKGPCHFLDMPNAEQLELETTEIAQYNAQRAEEEQEKYKRHSRFTKSMAALNPNS